MAPISRKYLQLVFRVSLLCFVLTTAAAEEGRARNGFYAGAAAGYGTFSGGDFKGDMFLSGNGQLFLIPGLSSKAGFGFVLGYRTERRGYELSYCGVSQTGDLMGDESPVKQHILDLSYLFYFPSKGPLQPYAGAGFNLSWLHVKDAFYKEDWYLAPGDQYLSMRLVLEGDSLYYSYGLSAEGGVDYFFTKRLSLNLGACFRFMMFHSARAKDRAGKAWGYSLEERLNLTHLGIKFGIRYIF